MADVLISNARVFTGTGSIFERGYLVTQDGTIIAIGPGDPAPSLVSDATLIDGTKLWLLPGLIDAHSHLCFGHLERRDRNDPAIPAVAASNARAKLLAGVTTVRDLGGMAQQNLAVKRRIEAGEIAGPRVLAAGEFICAPGGHCHYWAREARGPADVAAAAREQLDAGADVVKLMVSGGVADVWERPTEAELTLEEVSAAVHEAHARGKQVAAHAHPAAAIRVALQAGCDTIEHGTFLEPDVIELLSARGGAVIPTLCVYDRMSRNVDGIDAQVADLSRTVWNAKLPRLRAAVAARVRIGVGTDGGSYYPPNDLATELQLLVDAVGFTPERALLAATRDTATILRISHLAGTLEPGKSADCLLVEGAPLDHVTDVARLRYVLARGQVFQPSASPPPSERNSTA